MIDEATKRYQQGEAYGHSIKSGDIVWANLGDAFTGNMEKPGITVGTRPCLVVGAVGADSPMLTIIPMTTSGIKKDKLPNLHIVLSPEETGLDNAGVLLVEQMTTISKRQITYVDTEELYVDWDDESEVKHKVGRALFKLMG